MTHPEDNLPPVQPPSAGFLMQLFVVPMVIVVVIVMVCLMFNWLAHLGTQPQDLVADLSKLNAGSWQKALTIANMLTDRRNDALRRDQAMAQQLADVLDQELQNGDMSPERVKLRIYLCVALGVFEVGDGLPELTDAAETQRELAEIEVRKSAIEALASRASQSTARQQEFQQNERLMSVLRTAASQSNDLANEGDLNAQLRLRAVFALGIIGGSAASETLVQRLSDSEPAVRYNAATGLARYGDDRAIPRLLEMLQTRSAAGPDDDPAAEIETTTIIQNALRATAQLAAANSDADLSELRQTIKGLEQSPALSDTIHRGILSDLKATVELLDQRPSTTGNGEV